tara:strand:+ start:212 stop:547 length:336 start_codon:yes stop_codon:yes gene_type:complete
VDQIRNFIQHHKVSLQLPGLEDLVVAEEAHIKEVLDLIETVSRVDLAVVVPVVRTVLPEQVINQMIQIGQKHKVILVEQEDQTLDLVAVVDSLLLEQMQIPQTIQEQVVLV